MNDELKKKISEFEEERKKLNNEKEEMQN